MHARRSLHSHEITVAKKRDVPVALLRGLLYFSGFLLSVSRLESLV